MTKQRFYFNSEGVEDDIYLEAISKALDCAGDLEINKIIFLLPTKRSTGPLGGIFGEDVLPLLFKGTKLKDLNVLMKIETVSSYRDNYSQSEIVITCAVDLKGVLKIEDFDSVKVIIAIPWVKNELDKWVKTWSPVQLGKIKDVVPEYPEPSDVVKKAMEHLSGSINMSTGISHPSDNNRAKTIILALHKYEPSLNADIVSSYLVRELRWDTNNAQDIEKLINTLNNGKYFKGGERTGLRRLYKRWIAECK